MWYVYGKHIQTGKEYFMNIYDNANEAIHKIANCYEIDKGHGQLGEYYYFIKQH